MYLRKLRGRFVLGTLLLSASMAGASSVTYSYVGNDFTTASAPYTTSDSLDLTLSLAAPLGDNLIDEQVTPTAFAFSDGFFANSDTLGSFSIFYFDTNSIGIITGWDIEYRQPDGSTIVTCTDDTSNFGCDPGGNDDASYQSPGQAQAYVIDNPGTWTVVTSTPEPSTSALLLAGLGVTGVIQLVHHLRRRIT